MTLEELKRALAEANRQLAASQDPGEQATLKGQIAQGEQKIKELQGAQLTEVEQLRTELTTLRRAEADRDLQAMAAQMAQSVKENLDNARDQEQERLRGMVQVELQKVFVDSGMSASGKFNLGQLLQSATGMKTLGTKTPQGNPESPHFDPDRSPASWGGQAPGQIAQRGEKPGFGTFVIALGRKDLGTVYDLQRAGGIGPEFLTFGGYSMKALTAGGGAGSAISGPSGGYLVPPEYATDIIPLLYPYVALRRAGAKMRTMRSVQLFRPRLTGGSTATYVGEIAPIPTSQQTFDQFSLLAKELAAMIPISRLLVMTSDPSVEQIIREDMAKQIGLKEDITFMTGVGSITVPQGIFTRSDVLITNATDGTNGDVPTYDMIINMEADIDSANVPELNRVWVIHPRLKAALRRIKDGQQRPIFQEYLDVQQGSLNPGQSLPPRATLLGRPVFTSSQIPITTLNTHPTSQLAYVEMSQVVIGQLGEMELDASTDATYVDGSGATVSAFQTNQVVYRAIIRHDINLEHTSAVAVRNNVRHDG